MDAQQKLMKSMFSKPSLPPKKLAHTRFPGCWHIHVLHPHLMVFLGIAGEGLNYKAKGEADSAQRLQISSFSDAAEGESETLGGSFEVPQNVT